MNDRCHSDGGRDAVVVDTLLCFVINKRTRINDGELKNLIVNHFTELEIESAYDTLTKYYNFIVKNRRHLDADKNLNSSKIDSILQIFDLCEENEWRLPKFAAVDINNLPAADGVASPTTATDRDLLGRILQELKIVKRMVENFGQEFRRDKCRTSYDTDVISNRAENLMENMQTSGDTPSPLTDDTRGAVNVTVASSPTPSSDDPSPTDSVGQRRTNVGGGRKRGNSRGISSIEDAVAKLKAIRDSDSVQPSATAPSGRDNDTSSSDHGEQEIDKDAVDNSDVGDYLQNPFNFFAGHRTKQNSFGIPSLCSTVAAPLPLPIPCGASTLFGVIPSTDLGNFLRPSYMDVLAPFVAPSTAAVVNVDSSISAMTPSKTSPRHRTSCSSLKSYPCVQKLPKQNRVNISHSSAVPSASNGNGVCKMEPTENSSGANPSLLNVAAGDNDSTYKPYVCQHANCNKRFANKFLLKKHEFIHTGERPHQCTYCCKRFNRKDNLLRHKKTHEANYSLVRRRSRHLFGVGVGAKDEGTDDQDDQRPTSRSLSANNDSASMLISPRNNILTTTASSDSGGESGSPSTPTPNNEASSMKFGGLMKESSSSTENIFAFEQHQQVQFATALSNAYKASGLAALWSHAGGLSSGDN